MQPASIAGRAPEVVDRQPPVAVHEIKLVVPVQRAPAIGDWLSARCVPDPAHPEGQVSSMYFDGRDYRYLRAKINSDFIKKKVRIRWYGKPRTREATGPAFLEVKEKIGGRRFKLRITLPIRGGVLAAADFDDAVWRAALDAARDANVPIPHDLRPLMEISFHRQRFVDPTSGARLALDRDIRAPRVNPALLSFAHPFRLVHAVVEVKGGGQTLPTRLAPLLEIGCRRESFSKYERCVRKVMRRSSF